MSAASTGRFLAFELSGRSYAVEAEKVVVVLEPVPITRIPKAPEHFRGVINYRGSVIPVADIRLRFGEGKTSTGQVSRIIVLKLRIGQDDMTIGVLADDVREVIDLEFSQIESPPRIGRQVHEGFIKGIGEKGGEFIVILDIDRVLIAKATA